MGNGDETPLGAEDLQSYPDILLVWGPTDALTGAADLYVASAEGTAVRSLRRWPRRPDAGLSRPYGAFDALWSPNRDSIAVELGVWDESDPRSRIALVDPLGRDLQIITPGDDVSLYGWSTDGMSVIARDYRRVSKLCSPEGSRQDHFVSPAAGTSVSSTGRQTEPESPRM